MNCTYTHDIDEIPSIQWRDEMVNPVRKLILQSESTIFHSSFLDVNFFPRILKF